MKNQKLNYLLIALSSALCLSACNSGTSPSPSPTPTPTPTPSPSPTPTPTHQVRHRHQRLWLAKVAFMPLHRFHYR